MDICGLTRQLFPDVIPNEIATILLRLFPDMNIDEVLICVRDTFQESAVTQSLGTIMPIDPKIDRAIRELINAEHELLRAEFTHEISTIQDRRSQFEKSARSYPATYQRLQRCKRWTSPGKANSVLARAFTLLQSDLQGGFVSTSPDEFIGVFRVHRQAERTMFLDFKNSELIVISAGKDWYYLDPSVFSPKAMEPNGLIFSVRERGQLRRIFPYVTVVEFAPVSDEFTKRRLREIDSQISDLSRQLADDYDLLHCGSLTGDGYSRELTVVHCEVMDLLLGLKGLKRVMKATGTKAEIGLIQERIKLISRASQRQGSQLLHGFTLPTYMAGSLRQRLNRILPTLQHHLDEL
jgi:hypothetical protein